MLRLTSCCLFSFIVSIIEITWSAFDLAEEGFIFFLSSEPVGKFFIKADRKALISLADAKEEAKLTKSEFLYWILLLAIIVINFIWVIAAFKLLYGIVKVIFQDDRLKGIKCCRLWLKFSWLLLIIFGVKTFRDSSGWSAFFSALAVVLYRGGSMYIVHCFAKELEIAELLDPNLDIMVGGVTRVSGPGVAPGFHINRAAPGATLEPGAGGRQDVSDEVEVTKGFRYEMPMAVFDTHPV